MGIEGLRIRTTWVRLAKTGACRNGTPATLEYIWLHCAQDVTGTQLRDDLMTLLIAGHETTAATLTFAVYELTKPENRTLLAKIREEVDQVLGSLEVLCHPYPC